MDHPLDILQNTPVVRAFAERLEAGGHLAATGAIGSVTAMLSAASARLTGRTTVLVLAHLDEADEVVEEIASLAGDSIELAQLGALEALPGESNLSPELLFERLQTVRRVAELHLAIEKSPDGKTTRPLLIVTTIHALMQLVPMPARLDSLLRTIQVGQSLDPQELIRWLAQAGYDRVVNVEEPGSFAVRGGIIDIFPAGGRETTSGKQASGPAPVRLDFFGDELEKLSEIDLDTMASDRSIERVELVCADEKTLRSDDGTINFLELLPRESIALIAETLEVTEQGRGYFERVSDPRGIVGPPEVFKLLSQRFHALAEVNQFSSGSAQASARFELRASPLPQFAGDAAAATTELIGLASGDASGGAITLVSYQSEAEHKRLEELLDEHATQYPDNKPARDRVLAIPAYVHRGFLWRPDLEQPKPAKHQPTGPGVVTSLAMVPYHELVHRYHTRRRAVKLGTARAMDTFLDFAPGDIVVHADHGIARYVGLKLMKTRADRAPSPVSADEEVRDTGGDIQEFLELEFAGKARLFVPAAAVDHVQKYIGGFAGKPPLSTLGGERWKNQKAKVAESVRDLAAELLRVRAAREHLPGVQFPADTTWQQEFEEQFPYEETQDQLAALQEIKKDMGAPRPMDRLICGDVGFGKTELAIRAAFKACEFGKQVAVLVPTTVLAEQHERTFKGRFAGYPFRIESLSRFKTNAEANAVLAALRKGQVDLIIGTHRLLSADVKFADLGLVVVDEEQRFGVEHKERLLRLRLTVDVMTLSATPIPRTLHMAMLGLRDISSLTIAPVDRRAIVTEVFPYNERRIAQAIAREMAREGQVYFVHNRVHDIQSAADQVQKLAPDARIVIGHGQMSPHELEEVMLKFIRRQADILVSTTIIESGIDISTANTMIINDADRFGLADLHQLRGRVGRSKHRAYCYLLLPNERPVREVAQKRLKAIEQYSMLGAGFKIAMRDLEIRGAGNLLGAEQSGHIAAVGYEMFCRLLDGAVKDLSRPVAQLAAFEPSRVTVDVGVTGTITRGYIPSDQRRLEAYRRVGVAASLDELGKIRTDLLAAYGDAPKPVQRLLDLAELRIAASLANVRSITIAKGAAATGVPLSGEVDLIMRTPVPADVAERLKRSDSGRSAWRITPLAAKSAESLAEVYVRLPARSMDRPEHLVRMLIRRLGHSAEASLVDGNVGEDRAPKEATSKRNTSANRQR